MDFFEAQDRAKRRTKRLVCLFVLAVAGIIVAGYFGTLIIVHFGKQGEHSQRQEYWTEAARTPTLWDPRLLAGVTAGTLVIVGIASLFKWSQMRRGGPAVAEMVGGRAVYPQTTNLAEKRLLNVVEEMAIASGIPVPKVYVLDQEQGMNAFAAGLNTTDAAVAVTRGTLEKLTRDELQGVIGHEFSHILNGDMRLNVRITAIIFGILVIGLIGRGILRSIGRARISSGGGKNKGGGIALVLAVGLAFFIIGYVGYFFGRLIQAAVSRQREFLADASAVQFTRNPAGVSGALKKIGGYALGGTVTSNRAGEIGHFFFAQAFKSGFSGLWSTHPKLDERIRAIEPQWDGKLFDPPTVVDIERETFAMAGFSPGTRHTPEETLRRVEQAEASVPPLLPPTQRVPFQPKRVVAEIGSLTDAHFRQAQALLAAIPTRLRDAARDPASAQILVYGLLLNGDRTARDAQQAIVARHAGDDASAALAALRSALSLTDAKARLPLLQLALPALRTLDPAARDRFAATLDELVHADGHVSPFEFALQKMLLTQLRATATTPVAFDSFSAVQYPIAITLSAFAHFSPNDTAGAFAAGAAQLPMLKDQLALMGASACGLEQLDGALDKLAASSLAIKQQLLVALANVISSDGTITVEEGELYRAVAATLSVPMPSLESAA